ncbi:hypothetical protein PLANPX_0257 [Lacipirellula parvula]|uniref:Uncharacterized protein n=1 Tax=Lacipirellula parvula TaxID=2650471 RepID=A0A5K7X2T0_9BACT|nr:hypothetical protein PLANPX_0257 [Lacipirellula parvula]
MSRRVEVAMRFLAPLKFFRNAHHRNALRQMAIRLMSRFAI